MDKVILGIFAVIFLLLFSGVATSVYTQGDFWSIIDNSLVQIDTKNNVVIGENSSEHDTNKLYVNGSTYVNGFLFVDGEIKLYNNILRWGTNSGDACTVENANGLYTSLGGSDNYTIHGYGDTNFIWETGYPYPTTKFTIDENGNTRNYGNLTVDGTTCHYDDVIISGLTKNNQPHLMLRAQDTVGFNNYKQSEIRFFDNKDVVIGNIWYNKDLLTTTKGINIVSSADILLDANEGAGNIVLNGLTWWKDDIKILLGKDNLGIGARFEFYANNNNGYLNPLNWGLGGTSHPVSFIYNDNNEDTNFIVNSSQGESLVVDGATGKVNATHGYSTNVGDGLTFTFNCTEGEVFVTNGIITGKDW